ncbi:Hsp20/alpha crystallin family protein [Phenylobacterium sp.]|jgi:HSP20 family protein|uniref:Hsp20/alpha crystallin family protein n=1 Tax=Phenylobacterium sp. TaxID=1871053 RepID=UPI002E34A4EC|nr:Hsp20/alpha crystallin family protein [Phenylobacterium sp.]HEX3364449.1 Hsp20/alpha crystallin family protein [Phenylobacterium sp.]
MLNRDLTPFTGGRGLAPYTRDPFTSFRREVDRLLSDFYAPAEGRSFGAANGDGLWPNVDVVDAGQAVTVTAELPGLALDDIELELHDNALTISGEKKKEYKDNNGARAYVERTYGRFERTIPLAAEVDPNRVEARFKNGVLAVTLPKNERAQEKTRRIPIQPQG